MSLISDLEDKLEELKDKLSGDFHSVVLRLESVFDHVKSAEFQDDVKETLASEIHTAASHVEAVADAVRSNVDDAAEAVDSADNAVNKAAAKKPAPKAAK